MPSRSGVKLRPTIERDALYHRVLEPKKLGLSYNQIIARIQEERGTRLSKSHISEWLSGKHKPFGYVRQFEASPSAELAYVVGVKMGDASISKNKNHDYMVKLRVTDKDFAGEFSRCLSVLLHRSPPNVRWDKKTESWHVQASSLLLFNLLNKNVEELAPVITHCNQCEAAFLRGFFDPEGSVYRSSLKVSNGDLDKLLLVCSLLNALGIQSTGPHLSQEKGGMKMIKGRMCNINKDSYYVYVRAGSVGKFRERIGFSIFRKQARLDDAINIFHAGARTRRNG